MMLFVFFHRTTDDDDDELSFPLRRSPEPVQGQSISLRLYGLHSFPFAAKILPLTSHFDSVPGTTTFKFRWNIWQPKELGQGRVLPAARTRSGMRIKMREVWKKRAVEKKGIKH